MNKKISIIAVLLMLIATGTLLLVYAFRFEMKIPRDSDELAEFVLKDDFPRKWSIKEPEGGRISTMITDGIAVYYANNAGVTAVDGSSGEKLWRSEPVATTGLSLGDGIVAYGGNDGQLYAFDAVSGSEKWRFRTGEGSAAPAIAAGQIFYGEAGGLMHAFDAATGSENWHINVPGAVTQVVAGEGVVAVIAYDASVLTSTLIIIDAPTGRVKWQDTSPGEHSALVLVQSAVILQTADTRILPVTAFLTAYDVESQAVIWERKASSFSNVMKVIDGRLYVGSSNKGDQLLSGIEPRSGEEVWSYHPDNVTRMPQPSAVADGMVYFGTDAEIGAADATTGKLRWLLRGSVPSFSTPLVAGESLCFTNNATLYAIDLPTR